MTTVSEQTPIPVHLQDFTAAMARDDLAAWSCHGDSAVRVYWAEISLELVHWAEAVNLLSRDEESRLQRYQHPRAKSQFLAARTMLRTLLGHWLDMPPHEVPIQTLPGGKPILGIPGSNRHFNLSHTDGLAVVALACRPVGVDVEAIRPMPSAASLVKRFFATAEQQQYQQLPDSLKLSGFFRGWVGKEAILKGVGCGARGLEHCVVDLDPRHPARIHALSGPAAALGNDWSLLIHEHAPHWLLAVAHGASRPLVVEPRSAIVSLTES